MGFFKNVVRLVAYPALRPIEELKEASAKLKEDVDQARQARAKRAQDLRDRAEEYAKQPHAELTAEQMLKPSLIPDPRRRFEVVFEINKWTEDELNEQIVAARRAKTFAKYTAVAMFLFSLLTFWYSPVWTLVFLVPSCTVGEVVCVTQMFRFGLYQWQLEERCLYGPADYFSKPDFFQHVRS